MSRIGKKPVVIPSGVKVEQKDLTLTVTGPKGTLNLALHPKVNVGISEKELIIDVAGKDNKREKALWGLFRALIQNLVDGVTKGFEKKLEVNGVGFKMQAVKATQAQETYKKQLQDGIKQGKDSLVAEATYALGRLSQLQGQLLEMRLGFSHPIFIQIPEVLTVAIEKNVILITGADKQIVGQFAAEIRELKKPEPYKGKGIRYIDEVVRRKAGKVVKVVGGGK
jgi:large subunit ribosomal protein L6